MATMDIAAWLRGLGLEQYEPAFRANDVDARVLPGLTAEDLREIGVTSVGHRRLLLQAIAGLHEPPAPAAGPATGPAGGLAAPAVAAPPQAERRQLTVMFVDLVGSTALSHRLDPEDMREIIRAYQNAAAGEILRFAGHVAKFMGDGILAYFGWPRAQEDAAERAVRTGLAVTEAVRQLAAPAGVPLAVRVGIATGLVVVGELVGEGGAQEEAVVGETPNLAARLQALAEPGRVVIGDETRRLVGRLFELQALGARALKGLAEPVPAFAVLGASTVESRFEALHGGPGLTPLVGREEELELLLRRWHQATAGEGQVVLLAGEPGIGKSRLVRALRERLAGEPHLPLSHYCSPFFQASALHPVIGLLERAAGFSRDDTPDERLAKLEALLARGSEDPARAVPLIAALLGIPTGARYPPLDMSPQRQKEHTFEALIEQLEGLARRQPVLAVYEDAHWIDPSTQELLDRVVERVARLPVLALITFRPEYRPSWIGLAHVRLVALSRLGRREGAALAERVTHGKGLPAAVLEQIVAKTDGVPLFVEELTKAVLESGLVTDAGDRYELAGPLPPLAIPSTLHDSLLARLDRLAPVKEVAQIGAALGREFSHELLAAVAPLSDNELWDALGGLVEAELVFRRGTPPEASYVFKHALVQDTAYQSLLRSKRQQLHARIARVLEERFPATAEVEPELLAHHCTEAGLAEQAVGYWHQAGQRAIGRSALAEAVAHLTKGLGVLQGLPAGPERDRRELDLQIALGVALIPLKGQAAPETGRAYARARELCRQTGETERLLPVLYGQWTYQVVRAAFDAAREAGEELLRLGQRQDDVAAQVMAHRVLGSTHMFLGEFGSAAVHLERTVTLYDPARHGALAFLYAQDPRPTAAAFLSCVLLTLGHPDQARARPDEALAEARRLAHPNTLAQTLFGCCMVRHLLRDRSGVEELTEALIPLAAEQGFPYWLAMATILKGWALTQVGEPERGVDQIKQGLTAYRATGAENWVPYFLGLQAEAHGKAGQPAEGLDLLAEALERVASTGERWFEAELHRRRGELLLALPEPGTAEAEASLRRALAVAGEQGARLWELRAATSLARLWHDQGRRAEARDLLGPIHGWFTEGFDIPDLQDAKALLEELALTPTSSVA